MPKWLDMENDEIYRTIDPPKEGLPQERDPLNEDELDLGLRFFKKGDEKMHVKDLDSGTIGSGKNAGEALADLRSKMKTS